MRVFFFFFSHWCWCVLATEPIFKGMHALSQVMWTWLRSPVVVLWNDLLELQRDSLYLRRDVMFRCFLSAQICSTSSCATIPMIKTILLLYSFSREMVLVRAVVPWGTFSFRGRFWAIFYLPHLRPTLHVNLADGHGITDKHKPKQYCHFARSMHFFGVCGTVRLKGMSSWNVKSIQKQLLNWHDEWLAKTGFKFSVRVDRYSH